MVEEPRNRMLIFAWKEGEYERYKKYLQRAVEQVRKRVLKCETCALTYFQLTQTPKYCSEECSAEADRKKGRERGAKQRTKKKGNNVYFLR